MLEVEIYITNRECAFIWQAYLVKLEMLDNTLGCYTQHTYTLCTEINTNAHSVVAYNCHNFSAKYVYGCVSMK